MVLGVLGPLHGTRLAPYLVVRKPDASHTVFPEVELMVGPAWGLFPLPPVPYYGDRPQKQLSFLLLFRKLSIVLWRHLSFLLLPFFLIRRELGFRLFF